MFHVHHQASPSRSLNSGNSTASSNSNSVRSMVNGSAQKMTNSVTRNTQKVQSAVSAKSVNSQQNSFDEVDGDDQPAPEGLVKCAICKRNFAEDRLAKHQAICQKTKAKKRKVYDASKKRVQVSFKFLKMLLNIKIFATSRALKLKLM